MKNRIIKKFIHSSKDVYANTLGLIVSGKLDADIHTDRDNLTITIEFPDDDAFALERLCDYAARNEIAVKDGTNPNDVETLIFQRDEAQAGLLKMTEERNTYCNWWKDSKKECNRVKMQIQSIAALMNSIFPDVTNGAQE